jgi:hypothetical protein
MLVSRRALLAALLACMTPLVGYFGGSAAIYTGTSQTSKIKRITDRRK